METVIEVEAFGDFDVKYTVCIMVHQEKMDKNEILKEFYILEGITSNKGLDYRNLTSITNHFIAFLELKGFKKLKTEPIYFCD